MNEMNDMDNMENTEDLETVELDDLFELELYSQRAFYYPVNVVVRDGSDECHAYAGTVDFHHIKSLKIENPGAFFTSDDGRFFFAKDSECENLWLVRYLGDETEVVIPDGVYGIREMAFEENMNVSSVRLPESIRTIDEGAFLSCRNLRNINFPEGLIKIGEYAFQDTGLREVEFPSSLTSISEAAFKHCVNLKTVTFKANSRMEVLGNSFPECEMLTSFSFPDNLKTIEPYCFGDCDNLKTVHLPASVMKVGDEAFKNVSDIFLENIPEGIISSSLTYWISPDSIKSYTFTVHHNGSRIIFPKEITENSRIEEATKMLLNMSEKQDIAAFTLATNPECEIMTAIEALRYKVEDAKIFLENRGLLPVYIIRSYNENMMVDMLNIYDSNDMLSYELLSAAKDIAVDHSWLETSAYIIELMNKIGRKVSFNL